jgi:hypothetical protein
MKRPRRWVVSSVKVSIETLLNMSLISTTNMRPVRLAPRDSDSEPVDVLAILKEWSQREDAPRVVRESCVVAVDMWEVCTFWSTGVCSCHAYISNAPLPQYENSNEFQYANGLDSTQSEAPSDANVASEDFERENIPVVTPVAVGA